MLQELNQIILASNILQDSVQLENLGFKIE